MGGCDLEKRASLLPPSEGSGSRSAKFMKPKHKASRTVAGSVDSRAWITWEQALEFLEIIGPAAQVHTYMPAAKFLVGCDASLARVADLAGKYGISLSGPNMRRLNHGLTVLAKGRVCFYATRADKRTRLSRMAAASTRQTE
jgi:hypothetical protein